MNEFQESAQQESEFYLEQKQKVYQDELSFLNLHALNKSFHEKSSTSSDVYYSYFGISQISNTYKNQDQNLLNMSQDSSDSESFDKSSESNPYNSSSSSSSEESENIQEAIKERIKSQKLVRLHTGEKSTKNITQLLQYFLEKEKDIDVAEQQTKLKLIKKLNLYKFDIIMFYLAALMKGRDDETYGIFNKYKIQKFSRILFDKLKMQILDTREKQDDQKVNQIIYQLIEESKKKDISVITKLIIDNSSYLLKRVLQDKNIFYELFLEIIYNQQIDTNALIHKLQVTSTTVNKVLSQKRYEQILFLVNNHIKLSNHQQITFKHKDRFTYEGYLNKPLLKMNLRLVILYYLEKLRDIDLIKQLLFDVQQSAQQQQEILKVLIKFRANSVAKDIYRELINKKYLLDQTIFGFSLQVSNFDFMWFLQSQEIVILQNWLQEEETQQTLVDQLYKAEGKNFEYLIYYLKQIKRIQSKKTVKLLGETLIHRMEKSQEGQFLYTFYNPLKVSLLVCEILDQIISNVMHHKNILKKAHDLYYKFAQIFCFYNNDHQLMIELFKDIDLEKRKVVFLLNEKNGALILSTQIVEDAIEVYFYTFYNFSKSKSLKFFYISCILRFFDKSLKILNQVYQKNSLWNGNIAPRTNMMEMFSITQNLFFEEQCDYVMLIDSSSQDKFMVLNTNFQNHHFFLQRVVWTYNCRIRNFLDQMLVIILMLLIFANFIFLFKPQRDLQKILSEKSDNMREQESGAIRELQSIYFQYQIILDIIISINFTLKPLFSLYMDWVEKVQFKINPQDALYFILGLFSIFQIFFIPNVDKVEDPYNFKILLCFRCIYIGLVMMQLIFSLKSFKMTGPMITALYLVLLECNKSSFIFIMVNLVFGFMAYFSFYENENGRLKTLIGSLLYIIEALFGQFSFQEFKQPSPIYASIFLNIYLFFSPIIFMQLLVAILTFTFEKATRSGRIHYYVNIIEYLKSLEYNNSSGCLVALPIIGQFFNLIFVVVHLFSDQQQVPQKVIQIIFSHSYSFLKFFKIIPIIILNFLVNFRNQKNKQLYYYKYQQEQSYDRSRKISKILVRCGYLPIYIIFMSTCLLINLACSPILYIVKIFRILSESTKPNYCHKLKRLVQWIFFGYYYMFSQLYQDIKINHYYLMYGKYLNEYEEETIQNSTYSIVASVAKSLYTQMNEFKTKMVLSEFLNSILKKIKMMEQKLNLKKERQEVQINDNKQDNSQQKQLEEDKPQSDEIFCIQNNKSNENLQSSQKLDSLNNVFLDSVNHLPDSKNVNTLAMIENQIKESDHNDINDNNDRRYSTNFLIDNLLVSEPNLNLQTDEILQQDNLNIQRKVQSSSTQNSNNTNELQSQNQIELQLDNLTSKKQEGLEQIQSQGKKKKKVRIDWRKSVPQNNQKLKNNSLSKSQAKLHNFYDINAIKEQVEEYRSEKDNQSVYEKKIDYLDGYQIKTNNYKYNKGKTAHPLILSNIHDLKSASLFKKNNQKFTLETEDFQQKPKSNEQIDGNKQDDLLYQHQMYNPKQLFWRSLTKSFTDQLEQPHKNVSKSKKTTYQMWKELKKEENHSKNSIVQDIDLLFQFLDAFVVEEEEQKEEEDLASNYFKNEIREENEITDMIYIENLLKLMYHYGKNDVKLARFNIVSKSVKLLFSGQWVQPDPMQGSVTNQHLKH